MFFSIGLSGVAGSALLFVGLADKAKDSKEIGSCGIQLRVSRKISLYLPN